jgi:hypothetical protein
MAGIRCSPPLMLPANWFERSAWIGKMEHTRSCILLVDAVDILRHLVSPLELLTRPSGGEANSTSPQTIAA